MFCIPDTKSFESQFAQRRDSGFYTFREFHTFIRKLAARALLPKHVPEILDWKALDDMQGQNWKQLSNRDFLSRLKLKENLDACCLARVKRIYSEKQLTPEETEAAVEATRDEFATKARSYLVHLLKVFLADISLNAGIIRGLASFDPVALLNLPLEQATYCFSALHRSFSLRGWLENSSEADIRDEYVEFLEYFREVNSGAKNTPEVFTDMVVTLMGMPELKMRKHLFHLFQLSCLCLTSKSSELPAVKFSGVDCSEPRSRLFDVIMPAQSYLANVSGAVAACTTEASLGTFKDCGSAAAMSPEIPGLTLTALAGLIFTRFWSLYIKLCVKVSGPTLSASPVPHRKKEVNPASSPPRRVERFASSPRVDQAPISPPI